MPEPSQIGRGISNLCFIVDANTIVSVMIFDTGMASVDRDHWISYRTHNTLNGLFFYSDLILHFLE